VIVLVTGLELALRIGVLLVFPAVALRTWQTGGAARLWRAGAIAVAVIALIALYVATPASGNALVRTRGYGYTVPASLLLHGLTLGLPVVMTAALVRLLGPRLSSGLALYGLGVLMAGLAWIAGIGMALSLFYE
jgi:hypothetical protein